MLTNFGKLVRKLRIEHSMKLKDLAQQLKVSDAYLSAAEFGKRPVPDSWLDLIRQVFDLPAERAAELQEAIAETKKTVTLQFAGESDRLRREVAFAFARFVKDADEPTLEKFREYLQEARDESEKWKHRSDAYSTGNPGAGRTGPR